MIPAILAVAASLLQKQGRKRQAATDDYIDTVADSAAKLGGDTRSTNLYRRQAARAREGADYGAVLGLLGRSGGGDDAPAANSGKGGGGFSLPSLPALSKLRLGDSYNADHFQPSLLSEGGSGGYQFHLLDDDEREYDW